jgi:hypothetical protein
MSKLWVFIAGAVLSPVVLFFGEIAVFAVGLITIAVVGSTFFEELKKLEVDDD